jgi:hypothetical protein
MNLTLLHGYPFSIATLPNFDNTPGAPRTTVDLTPVS